LRRSLLLLSFVALSACGSEKEAPAPDCVAVAEADFAQESGWNVTGYCSVPTDLGCYPWHGASEDACGPFTTMRTSVTTQASADACATLLTALNCGEFAEVDGTNRLSFFVEDADRFTMRAIGSYNGADVDTTFYFNPCHQNCQAAVTLEVLDADQQKICEIPRQGEPACLFPETAHSMTFVRADGGSVVLRTAGNETVLARVVNGE
jgi:hypothetical protein